MFISLVCLRLAISCQSMWLSLSVSVTMPVSAPAVYIYMKIKTCFNWFMKASAAAYVLYGVTLFARDSVSGRRSDLRLGRLTARFQTAL